MRILYNSLEVPHVLNTKLGELIYNKHDKVLYTKDKYLNILKIATGGSGNGVNGKDGKDGKDGVSFNIQGTDTYANIIAKPNPKKGDMWIASDRNGHGIVFNGLKWADVGQITGPKGDKGDQGLVGAQGATGVNGKSAYDVWLSQGNTGTVQDFFIALEGQQGVQGQKGIQGTGIHFENSYATKADMIAANPNPDIGDTHLVTDTGDMWTWDNPNPPHDPAGAIWNDIGHVQGAQGNAGVQGIQGLPGHDGQPGKDGKDGDPLQLATDAETIAGIVNDKANTPESTRAAYVPKVGGTYTGTVQIPTLETDRIEDTTNNKWWIGRNSKDTSFMFYNDVSNAYVSVNDKGDVSLVPNKGSGKAYANGSPIITEKNGMTRSSGVGHFPYDGATKRAYILFAREGGSSPKDYGMVGYSYTLHGMVLKNYLYGNYVQVRNTGEIALSPKNGKKATVNGKNILTGHLSGHTLHLDF